MPPAAGNHLADRPGDAFLTHLEPAPPLLPRSIPFIQIDLSGRE